MWLKVNPNGRIFTLDTKKLPKETYALMDEIVKKYKVDIEVYKPDEKEVLDMEKRYGPELFYKSIDLRKLCCEVRKLKPLSQALSGLDAWICGLRKEQSLTRSGVEKIEYEKRALSGKKRKIVKINPLADWTEKDVWSYIRQNKVPHNKLHDKGYPSIGCAPCTRAVKPGEDIRAGRWWWESPEQKECGLHTRKTKSTSK
jgi:phosphoadenosine phosphosulfate reductase